ncbi:MAG: twin-arginine translocase TatA/TatE family subunit [Abditibacteriaceae bacterium]
MLDLGPDKLIIILVIVLVLFGGTKIPQMMKGLGEGMKEFRKATHDGDPENEPRKTTSEGSEKNV